METQANPFTQVPPQIVHDWGLFLVLGLGLIGLSIITAARSGRASGPSVYLLGWLLVFASAIEAWDAYLTGGWIGFYFHLVGAILFGVAGYMLLTHANTNAETGSLIVAMYFIIAGIFNIIAPLAAGFPDRGWHIWAGFITLVLGPLLLSSWTVHGLKLSSIRAIGIFIGIDLFFRGLALTVFAL